MIQDVSDWDFERVVEGCPTPVLVEFWQPGCGHCQALLKELERLQAEMGPRIRIVKANVQDARQIASELEITSLPALALYENGTFQRFLGGIGTKEHIKNQLPGL